MVQQGDGAAMVQQGDGAAMVQQGDGRVMIRGRLYIVDDTPRSASRKPTPHRRTPNARPAMRAGPKL